MQHLPLSLLLHAPLFPPPPLKTINQKLGLGFGGSAPSPPSNHGGGPTFSPQPRGMRRGEGYLSSCPRCLLNCPPFTIPPPKKAKGTILLPPPSFLLSIIAVEGGGGIRCGR